jgi:hypothetical protein
LINEIFAKLDHLIYDQKLFYKTDQARFHGLGWVVGLKLISGIARRNQQCTYDQDPFILTSLCKRA